MHRERSKCLSTIVHDATDVRRGNAWFPGDGYRTYGSFPCDRIYLAYPPNRASFVHQYPLFPTCSCPRLAAAVLPAGCGLIALARLTPSTKKGYCDDYLNTEECGESLRPLIQIVQLQFVSREPGSAAAVVSCTARYCRFVLGLRVGVAFRSIHSVLEKNASYRSSCPEVPVPPRPCCLDRLAPRGVERFGRSFTHQPIRYLVPF